MKGKYFLALTAVISCMQVSAQESLTPSHEETVKFIEHSINQLKKLDPAGEVPSELKQHYGWFQTDMATCEKQEYFEKFLQEITDQYQKQNQKASLKFNTKNEGAIIKFQTIYEKQQDIPAREADNPTNNCAVSLPPGQYYIWSERDGKITSPLRSVYISLDTSLITINEKE